MGSSPVTATISPSPGSFTDRLAAHLEAFLRSSAEVAPGDPVIAAFSGGPDSTALLAGLRRLTESYPLRLVAVHVDHGLDAGAGERAEAARALAAAMGVPFRLVQGRIDTAVRERHGLEAAARALRYASLESAREEEGARWILTGHHRDDQAETVLLRMAYGTGLRGLAGMDPLRNRVARPMLEWPRAAVRLVVREAGLEPVRDPTNRDPDRPRNRLRHGVLAGRPGWADSAVAVAAAAGRLRERLDRRLSAGIESRGPGVSLPLDRLRRLPPELRAWVLALLHEAAGRPHPAPAAAVDELGRQLEARGRVGVHCGDGWRWVGEADRLHLRAPRAETPPFAYTFEVPGVVELREIGCRLRVERQPVASWMWEGRPDRAALGLPFEERGAVVQVRSRLPGDRLRPLGSRHERSLKEMLIDRKIAREERNRLPLLCVEGVIAWVPGVTIHEAYRLEAGDESAWVAILEPSP